MGSGDGFHYSNPRGVTGQILARHIQAALKYESEKSSQGLDQVGLSAETCNRTKASKQDSSQLAVYPTNTLSILSHPSDTAILFPTLFN
jgi:hypothetical protein